jgi:hypothetical protein
MFVARIVQCPGRALDQAASQSGALLIVRRSPVETGGMKTLQHSYGLTTYIRVSVNHALRPSSAARTGSHFYPQIRLRGTARKITQFI